MSGDGRGVVIGIDACSLAGGGSTHLIGVLGNARPEAHGIAQIRVWGKRSLLDQLPDEAWLEKISLPEIEGSRWRRVLWQATGLRAEIEGCDLFFWPGAFVPFRFDPMVVMTQNSLLFDLGEQSRYGISAMRLRLQALRRSQIRSVRHAAGVVFLTDWGEKLVRDTVEVTGATCVAPHGIDERFLAEPRRQESIDAYSDARPLRLVYVSIIDVYKHQWHVARAVARLRAKGLPVEITLAGPAFGPALQRLERTLDEVDPERRFVHYVGPVPYDELPGLYAASDVCVFASSCENLPNILLEAMGCAIPIACSGLSPMVEVIQDGGVLFDPENPESIADAVESLIRDPALRERCARRARELAAEYSWQRCSAETLAFLAEVARGAGGAAGEGRG